ncbi:ABC transporter substrate-binding protein [Streptomyces zhihengii]
MYGEIRDLARAFGVEERGEDLVARLQERCARPPPAWTPRTSPSCTGSPTRSPLPGGLLRRPGAITRAVGARNAFTDTHDEWPQINWETVADRDPDVIVLGDLTRKSQTAESAAAKIRFLRGDPATRNLTAVRENRFILLSGQAMNPSLRTVEGIEQVAAGLRELGLAG